MSTSQTTSSGDGQQQRGGPNSWGNHRGQRGRGRGHGIRGGLEFRSRGNISRAGQEPYIPPHLRPNATPRQLEGTLPPPQFVADMHDHGSRYTNKDPPPAGILGKEDTKMRLDRQRLRPDVGKWAPNKEEFEKKRRGGTLPYNKEEIEQLAKWIAEFNQEHDPLDLGLHPFSLRKRRDSDGVIVAPWSMDLNVEPSCSTARVSLS